MHGYHRLAGLMGQADEFAIFRRFRSLNAFALLSLQAEISNLESRFRQITQRDIEEGDEFHVNFRKLFDSSRIHNGRGESQLDTLILIRQKLREYSMHSRLSISKIIYTNHVARRVATAR